MDTYEQDKMPLTVGQWMITLFILAIPLVNLIMMLVWSFSTQGNIGRRNFCMASLIYALIGFVIVLVLHFLGPVGA